MLSHRRFLLNALPLRIGRGQEIKLGYLASPDSGLEATIRSDGRQRDLTIRKGTEPAAAETTVHLPRNSFENLWGLADGSRIRKMRYSTAYRGATIMIDQYHDDLESLVVANLESTVPRSVAGLELAPWLGAEITGLIEYLDHSLVISGLPADFPNNRPRPGENGLRPISHAGAVPYRIANRKLQILCITSRSGKRWIVPKGFWEAGHTLQHTAVTEAWEEAGVRGQLGEEVLGIIDDDRPGKYSRILLFPLEVEEEAERWPEESFRTRVWMDLGTAIQTVTSPGLADLLRKLGEQ